MRGWLAIGCAGLLLLAAGACGGGTAIELTQADGGSTVEATVGQELVVTLEANPTTGYEWRLAGALDEAVLEQVSQTYEPESEGVVGGGGTDTWTFRATGEGTARIRLEYLQPFDPASLAETFELTVDVSAG